MSLVLKALVACESTPDIKAVKVTKILHRKRPALVPIFDSRVAAFYGVSRNKPWDFWPVIQKEVLQHADWLHHLTRDTLTPDGRPVTELRVLDIVVWEHVKSIEFARPQSVEPRQIRGRTPASNTHRSAA